MLHRLTAPLSLLLGLGCAATSGDDDSSTSENPSTQPSTTSPTSEPDTSTTTSTPT